MTLRRLATVMVGIVATGCTGMVKPTQQSERLTGSGPLQSLTTNGLRMPSLAMNGFPSLAMNGFPSLAMNGFPSLAMNGLPSLAMNGFPSLAMNGLTATQVDSIRAAMNGLSSTDLASSPAPTNAYQAMQESPNALEFFKYMYACAIPSGSSLSIVVAPVAYAQTDLPANLQGICAVSSTAATDGGAGIPGVACQFQGGLGLAPDWQQTITSDGGSPESVFSPGSVSSSTLPTEQRWVSACMLALVNAYGATVHVSLRAAGGGPGGVLAPDAVDPINDPSDPCNGQLTETCYSQREGSYYGNVFASPQAEFSCSGPDSNFEQITNRACSGVYGSVANGGCPMTIVGDCLSPTPSAQVCQGAASDGNATGAFVPSNCVDSSSTVHQEVITVFLPPTRCDASNPKFPACCSNGACEPGEQQACVAPAWSGTTGGDCKPGVAALLASNPLIGGSVSTVDAQGNIYIAGSTQAPQGQPSSTQTVVASYDSSGNARWSIKPSFSNPSAIALDPAGNVVIGWTGPSGNGAGLDVISPGGSDHPMTNSFLGKLVGVGADSNGSVWVLTNGPTGMQVSQLGAFLAGASSLAVLNQPSPPQISNTMGGPINGAAMAFDGTGAYVAVSFTGVLTMAASSTNAMTFSSGPFEGMLMYVSNGYVQGEMPLQFMLPTAMAIDSTSGAVVLGGGDSTGANFVLAKCSPFSSRLVPQWVTNLPMINMSPLATVPGDPSSAKASSIGIDGQGNIYVAGTFSGRLLVNSSLFDGGYFGTAFLQSWTSGGTPVGFQPLGGTAAITVPGHLAVTSNGVLLTGTVNGTGNFDSYLLSTYLDPSLSTTAVIDPFFVSLPLSSFGFDALPAPTLTAPSNGATSQPEQPTLSWNTVTGASMYSLQVSTSATFTAIVSNFRVGALSASPSNLSPGTTYYWRVQAIGTSGSSPWSPTWSFTTAVLPPAAPALALPSNGTGFQAISPTLSWNTAAGATSYSLQVSTDSLFQTTVVNSSAITGTLQVVSGLSYGTTYYWRVSATNSGGTSPWSSSWSFATVAAPPAPPAPTLASPINGDTGDNTALILAWNAVSGASSYTLEVSLNQSFSTTVLIQPGSTPSQPVSGLAWGITYYWRVCASNANGTGAWSQIWSFTTAPAGTVPTLSSPPNGAGGQNQALVLSWIPGVPGPYTLQVSTSPMFSTTVFNQSGITTTSQAVAYALASNTVYYWRVSSKNGSGFGGWSQTWSFQTGVLPPAAPPGTPSPSVGASNQSLAPTLSWSEPFGASSYALQVSTSSNFSTLLVNLGGLTKTSQSISGLAPSTTYFWRVSATNSSGSMGWAGVWSFKTGTAPPPPSQPSLTFPGNNASSVLTPITMSWTSTNGASSYTLQVSTNSSFSSTIFNQSGITATSQSVSGLSAGPVYYWRVGASNAGGTTWSATWSFTAN
jgi:hypothetical protein